MVYKLKLKKHLTENDMSALRITIGSAHGAVLNSNTRATSVNTPDKVLDKMLTLQPDESIIAHTGRDGAGYIVAVAETYRVNLDGDLAYLAYCYNADTNENEVVLYTSREYACAFLTTWVHHQPTLLRWETI